ncbi:MULTISPECIES: conjugal transfer protein MobB [Dysgonomonas]|uniref:conjugal transfer protein MobB n=1 Tax=Dysgonomonas TaxID=156973 RepID=UPI00092CC4B3|nr:MULTISPECIES: conjugal transfer protein MobB [Dysgonomonas]MBN9300828.1 relaxase/mobilization nuclease domain-containing protein [Dysgonomonas mossii]OJX59505.1 MAG: mobilization protein [Dysgonomonas sp. 37-18]
MVAKFSHVSNLYGALTYNQEKVDEGLGKVLATNLVIEPTDGVFNVSDCMQDFERFMPSHIRTSKPVIHISLNPHPDDKLTDNQLADIGREYMERFGYGGQPYMIFKHEDIGREHIHIISTRVRTDGSIISDSKNYERSRKITDLLEQKYGLHSKEKNQGEAWQLSPIDVSQGNLKKQVANVIKPLSEMYCFQALGEYRALLSLYNIGVEEIKGENKGRMYRGLVYSALDNEGKRVGAPLKSSLFGKDLGLDRLEKRFDKSKETIKATGITKQTRANVSASFANTRTESESRADLREKGIDLVLRRNDEGRIYGATFIDHNQRAVLNGSRLGKEFSANVLNERFADNPPREDLQAPKPSISPNQSADPTMNKHPQSQSSYSQTDDPMGSLFSVFTPEVSESDNKRSTLKRKRKKKRRYGRQM